MEFGKNGPIPVIQNVIDIPNAGLSFKYTTLLWINHTK
jgi:hypothetical protein